MQNPRLKSWAILGSSRWDGEGARKAGERREGRAKAEDGGRRSEAGARLEELKRYIDHQEQHHRTQTFQEDYRGLLAKYHVEFDERCVWD